MIAKARLSWTQPICDDCWRERSPGRGPNKVVDPEKEQCVDCGYATKSGIYIRLDPTTTQYPTKLKD